MKKTLVSLVAMATIAISSHAQISKSPGHSKRESSQMESRKHFNKPDHKQMHEALQLTSAQKEQMKAINMDLKNKMKALKSSNLSAGEYDRKKAELVKERNQKISALLTPEQRAKMEQVKKEYHGQRKMASPERMEKMKEKLALSDEQVAKIREQREAFRSKLDAIRNNEGLSADDKKSQLKTLREEQRNSFRSILTPEQARKLEEMKQKRAGKSA